jgi:uncharacterized integral membrane protein
MLRFLKYVVLAPVAIILLIFAIANREMVTVHFDPLDSGDIPNFVVTAPLFLVLIVTAMLGVVAGAAATWLAQGRYRRAARLNRAEADKWRGQAEIAKNPPDLQPGVARRV